MTLVALPREFVCRIGELESSDLVSDVMATFSLVESLFKGAEEFIWGSGEELTRERVEEVHERRKA